MIFIVPVREVQFINVLVIFVTPFGITGAVVRDLQPQNVWYIFVTLSGISGAAVREVQSINVLDIFRDIYTTAYKKKESSVKHKRKLQNCYLYI